MYDTEVGQVESRGYSRNRSVWVRTPNNLWSSEVGSVKTGRLQGSAGGHKKHVDIFLVRDPISTHLITMQYFISDVFGRRTSQEQVRFEVIAAVSMKMAVFWVVAPCSLVEVYRRFRGACCFWSSAWWRRVQPSKQLSWSQTFLSYKSSHLIRKVTVLRCWCLRGCNPWCISFILHFTSLRQVIN
jgi:hypothetical protein